MINAHRIISNKEWLPEHMTVSRVKSNCLSFSKSLLWTLPTQMPIISSLLPFHLSHILNMYFHSQCLLFLVGGMQKTLHVTSIFLTSFWVYSTVLLTIYPALLYNRALKLFHLGFLKLYTHGKATSNVFLPLVSGIHHSTFCIYAFYFFEYLM